MPLCAGAGGAVADGVAPRVPRLPDHAAGRVGKGAKLAHLAHLARTRKGQQLSLAFIARR